MNNNGFDREEAAGIKEFFAKFDRLPGEMADELATLEANLNK